MNEKSGRIIHINTENMPIPGCTVSKQIYHGNGNDVYIFSLAPDTEISAESYEYHKMLMVYEGELIYIEKDGKERHIAGGSSILTPKNKCVGMRSTTNCIYLEIGFEKETKMNQILKAGEVFRLGELLPYQDGKIVNMDLVNEENFKFVLMSFDKGTGLSEHAAPGEALVLALDGEAIIGYEGKEFTLKAGETFKFDKMGKHSVTATDKFKMALMLVMS